MGVPAHQLGQRVLGSAPPPGCVGVVLVPGAVVPVRVAPLLVVALVCWLVEVRVAKVTHRGAVLVADR
jgi:hypothetical protein